MGQSGARIRTFRAESRLVPEGIRWSVPVRYQAWGLRSGPAAIFSHTLVHLRVGCVRKILGCSVW